MKGLKGGLGHKLGPVSRLRVWPYGVAVLRGAFEPLRE
jgi:hypothetical protein